VISNPEVNRTLATLRKAEFGFFGVIVEKLTDKSPLLSLYRTVHEIFTSYGSSFNSFEVIGSFSSFENLLPSSTPSRRVTNTNSVTFSCSNWTLSIFDYDRRRRLFTKHMRIKSRYYNKNKRSFSINPFVPQSSRIRKILFEFEFVHLESGFFYLYLFFFIYLLYWFPFSFILFYSLFHFDFLSFPLFFLFPSIIP